MPKRQQKIANPLSDKGLGLLTFFKKRQQASTRNHQPFERQGLSLLTFFAQKRKNVNKPWMKKAKKNGPFLDRSKKDEKKRLEKAQSFFRKVYRFAHPDVCLLCFLLCLLLHLFLAPTPSTPRSCLAVPALLGYRGQS